jgi:hypothetical protein
VIKRARKEARAIEARRAGLPFPVGTPLSDSERRGFPALERQRREERPVTVRQMSQNDVGLPSYSEWHPVIVQRSSSNKVLMNYLPSLFPPADPGIKVPETMYNPATAGSITPYPQPPAPSGAPPGYSFASPPPVRA